MNTDKKDEALKRLFGEQRRLDSPQIPSFEEILNRRRPRFHFLPLVRPLAAAAAIILVIGIAIPVWQNSRSRPTHMSIEKQKGVSQKISGAEPTSSEKKETHMNSPEKKNKQARSNPLYALVFSLLFLPTGVSGQIDPGTTASAEKAIDLSYLKDNLSDFIAERVQQQYGSLPESNAADLAHLKHLGRGDRIQQKQLTLPQTLDTFLSLDQKDLGTPVFHGKYARRNGGWHFGAPTDFWLIQTPEGTLTAVTHVTALDYAMMASSNPLNQMTCYRIAAAAMDDLPAYQIQYEFKDGAALKISKTKVESFEVGGLLYPQEAINYDSFTAANIALRGLALKGMGDSRNISAFEIDVAQKDLVTYTAKVEHKGKEVISLPVGTFNANHIEVTATSDPTTSSLKRAGQITQFWILDNGVILRILSSRNAETYLTEYVAPTRLEGTVEDPFMKSVSLAPNTLVKMDVPALSTENAAWITSGYSVNAGDKIAFRATGMTKADPAETVSPLDADGKEVDHGSMTVPFLGPNSPGGALIGKIACIDKPSEIFTIGKESVYEAKQSGVLFLAVNDQYGTSGNNSGVLKTEFIIGDLPPATSETQQTQQTSRTLPLTVRGVGQTEKPYGVFTSIQADPNGTETYGHVQPVGTISGKDLGLICSVAITADGRHIYSSACNGSTICTLDRNPETGELQITQTIQDPRFLNGVVAARLSPDNRYVATVACHADSVILFVRDPESGLLVAVDMVLNEDLKDRTLNFPTNCAFSPDSRFLYTITSSGAVSAFKVSEPGKLEWTDAINQGEEGCFGDARGITFSPDGKSIYVASARGNTLVTLDRDVQSGKMEIRQIIKDGEAGTTALAGAEDVSCSPDGKYVYVCSGRFRGDNAVSVFKVGENKTLSLLQEIHGSPNGPLDYRGGDAIIVTPDGKKVFASGTLSSTVVCFTTNPDTGMLNLIQTLTSNPENPAFLRVPNQITFSPDGKFLYVTSDDNAIAVYKWND